MHSSLVAWQLGTTWIRVNHWPFQTERCQRLAAPVITLFTSVHVEARKSLNCTKPLIIGYNFLFYCNPFLRCCLHFLFQPGDRNPINVFSFMGERTFKHMKTSHYFLAHTHKGVGGVHTHSLLPQQVAEGLDCQPDWQTKRKSNLEQTFHPSVVTHRNVLKRRLKWFLFILFYLTKLKTHWDRDLFHEGDLAKKSSSSTRHSGQDRLTTITKSKHWNIN